MTTSKYKTLIFKDYIYSFPFSCQKWLFLALFFRLVAFISYRAVIEQSIWTWVG